MTYQSNYGNAKILRTAFESYFDYRGWATNSTPNTESIRFAALGALCGAPETANRTEIIKLMCADFRLIAEILDREIGHEGNYTGTSTAKATEIPVISNTLSIGEVVSEFGISKNSVKNKQWRDDNNFPYMQIKRGGKVTCYRDKVEQWIANRNTN